MLDDAPAAKSEAPGLGRRNLRRSNQVIPVLLPVEVVVAVDFSHCLLLHALQESWGFQELSKNDGAEFVVLLRM